MAAWTTPITWINGAVTTAQMNGVRDNLVWLKAAIDLITAATAADSGAATRLAITRATATDAVLGARVSGDTVDRLTIRADGRLGFGAGGASTQEVFFGRISLNRVGVTDGTLGVERDGPLLDAFVTKVEADSNDRLAITADGVLRWGSGAAAYDVSLYRPAAGVLGLGAGMDFRIPAGRALQYGPAGGATTSLTETTGGRLETQQFRATDGIITKTKAGIPSDADFTTSPISGTIAIDSTNNRIYVRSGTVWRYAQLT